MYFKNRPSLRPKKDHLLRIEWWTILGHRTKRGHGCFTMGCHSKLSMFVLVCVFSKKIYKNIPHICVS